MNLGMTEIIIIAIVVLVLFGGKSSRNSCTAWEKEFVISKRNERNR